MHFQPVIKLLEEHEVPYSIGGSLLLFLKGLSVQPNDVDLLVKPENFSQAKQVLQKRAVQIEDKPPQGRYITKACTTFTMLDNIQVDLMADFAVTYEDALFRMPFTAVKEQTTAGILPLGSMEAWSVIYWLLPNKEAKRKLMERYFQLHGLSNRHILEEARRIGMPAKADHAIGKLLNKRN
ncbi:nucleotidyltransferase family protein [Terribacillus sp. DMT04]|uniref:nucleotidyltransferase family protein n=1 Tax=Terribacillus sp. DMT04 TaxID=2850441 RepID=UPI001C2C2379|nr:nucleotidyltransferase family protein [Terribacillus sp. DMT04]QXE02591.1 nucleotidyltransferase family protein [Terribacillus sp. DMT04]